MFIVSPDSYDNESVSTFNIESSIIFPDESIASNTVTAVKVPEGIDADHIRKIVSSKGNVILAGAYGELTGKMFRIGHMGYVSPQEINHMLEVLGEALQEIGIS